MSEALDDVVVLRALNGLDPLERVALHLVYGQGLTQAQVAAELRLPVPTIRSAVAHGMRQLATAIAPPR